MSEHITHTANVKRLERSSTDRHVAGVSGGLGRYFDLNPSVFRLGFIVLTLLGGAGILVYLAAVLVVPAEGSEQSIAAEVLAERRDRPMPVVGLGLAGVALIVLLSRGDLWPGAGAAWALLLVGGLIVLWASRGHSSRARRVAIGVIATLTIVLAAAVAAIVVAFSWFDVSLSDGVGDRAYAPVTAASVKSTYETGIGKLTVDLSHVSATTPIHVRATVGMGELKVIVPHDAKVDVDARAKAGQLNVLRYEDDGRNASVRTGKGNAFRIDARVGAGQIDVVRAS